MYALKFFIFISAIAPFIPFPEISSSAFFSISDHSAPLKAGPVNDSQKMNKIPPLMTYTKGKLDKFIHFKG